MAERFIIVLDPGHGGNSGSQNGAIGPSGLKEKKITFQIAQRVRRELSTLPGVEVIMTRQGDEDISMAERVALANQARADLFLSIHCNGNQAAWYRGLETFFHSVEASSEEARRVASEENAMGGEKKGPGQDAVASILMDMQRAEVLRDSSQMAQLLHSRLVPVLGFPDHGVMQADFFVLRSTRMPAALVEVGFITNPVEEQAVRRSEVQEQVAKACLEAVRDYRALMERKEVRSVPAGP